MSEQISMTKKLLFRIIHCSMLAGAIIEQIASRGIMIPSGELFKLAKEHCKDCPIKERENCDNAPEAWDMIVEVYKNERRNG